MDITQPLCDHPLRPLRAALDSTVRCLPIVVGFTVQLEISTYFTTRCVVGESASRKPTCLTQVSARWWCLHCLSKCHNKKAVVKRCFNCCSCCISRVATSVVWNPWHEKAVAMSDFGDDEYPYMLCVEAGRVVTPQSLAAGQRFHCSQVLTALA